MFSQCPKCLARFRVSAATLRAAHGRARCGHCGKQFDALERLTDELPPKAELPTVTAAPETTLRETSLAETSLAEAEAALAGVADAEIQDVVEDLGPEDYHFSAEDIEKVFIDARDWQQQYGAAPDTRPADAPDAPDDEASELQADEPSGFEDITLEGLKAQIKSDTGELLRIEAEFDEIDEIGDEDPAKDEDEDEDVSIDDLDDTSRLRMLKDVPDSAYPEDDEDEETKFYRALIEGREIPSPSAAKTPATQPVTMPAPAVARSTARTAAPSAAAAGLASSHAATLEDDPFSAELRAKPAQRWSGRSRRGEPRDPVLDLDLGDHALPRSRRPGVILAVASLALAFALAMQVAHYFRQEIARHPQAGPMIRSAYAWLGMPLSPNWDLDAFEIRQWGPTTDVAPGAPLTVRASLTNRAAHAQPYPLLRLEFEDRFGAGVAQRDFAPTEYLKSAPQGARQLRPGETTEAELSVIAPGPDAVGYRLEICLREDADLVRCAQSPG